MALIEQFIRKDFDRPTLHDPVVAGYAMFERDGRRLLQINTYGSNDREFPGKLSQTMQLNEESANALRAILDEAFPR